MKNLRLTFLLVLLSILMLQCQSAKDSEDSKLEPLHEIEKISNLEFARPDGFSLTTDLYIPKTGMTGYPVLIVYHGGGWTINNKSIMDSLSMYIAGNSEIMVMNVNYRLLTDQDNTVKINQTAEDALGAFLWAKYNIASYGGDPANIAVTGDSAGGHLAMMVALGRRMIGDKGFGPDKFYFYPSWMPEGISAQELTERDLSISAVIPNYGVFDLLAEAQSGFETEWMERGMFGDSINFEEDPEYYRAVSPIYLVPENAEYELPPILLTVGSEDNVTPPESIVKFREELNAKGHDSEYWVYEGMPHAYLDSKLNTFSGTATYFRKDAPYAVDKMIEFLNQAYDLN